MPIVPSSYDEDGFVLRRGLLPSETFKRVHEVAVRVHALWLEEQGEDARRKDLVNSHSLTASRYFPSEYRSERVAFFDALADPVLFDLVTELFGEELCFHGTQMFFNPLGGARKPYWHRDIQYLPCDEPQQAALLSELCNLHIRVPLRPETGFLLVPGSHARWDTDIERAVRLELSGHSNWEDLASARAFDLEPGDVLIFSAHMLHRGTYAGNTERLSFDFMLGKPHSRMPSRLGRDQLLEPNELLKVRQPRWYERAYALLCASRADCAEAANSSELG
jgi:hypothetical protein